MKRSITINTHGDSHFSKTDIETIITFNQGRSGISIKESPEMCSADEMEDNVHDLKNLLLRNQASVIHELKSLPIKLAQINELRKSDVADANLEEEVRQLNSLRNKLKEQEAVARRQALNNETSAAAWRVQAITNLKGKIHKKMLDILKNSPFLELAQIENIVEISSQTSEKRKAKKSVTFSDEVDCLGIADEDYDRSSHEEDTMSSFEETVLRLFGTFPDEFPELFGYAW